MVGCGSVGLILVNPLARGGVGDGGVCVGGGRVGGCGSDCGFVCCGVDCGDIEEVCFWFYNFKFETNFVIKKIVKLGKQLNFKKHYHKLKKILFRIEKNFLDFNKNLNIL